MLTCKKCKTGNEYAEPNQSDGGFVCFGCRSAYGIDACNYNKKISKHDLFNEVSSVVPAHYAEYGFTAADAIFAIASRSVMSISLSEPLRFYLNSKTLKSVVDSLSYTNVSLRKCTAGTAFAFSSLGIFFEFGVDPNLKDGQATLCQPTVLGNVIATAEGIGL